MRAREAEHGTVRHGCNVDNVGVRGSDTHKVRECCGARLRWPDNEARDLLDLTFGLQLNGTFRTRCGFVYQSVPMKPKASTRSHAAHTMYNVRSRCCFERELERVRAPTDRRMCSHIREVFVCVCECVFTCWRTCTIRTYIQ